MKDFNEVVKLKIVPATFVFRCSLCRLDITEYDRHLGLIKMNEHLLSKHPDAVKALDMEDLYSRKPDIHLESF